MIKKANIMQTQFLRCSEGLSLRQLSNTMAASDVDQGRLNFGKRVFKLQF